MIVHTEFDSKELPDPPAAAASLIWISEFVLDEKFQQNASKFAIPILYKYIDQGINY